jgi:hypothetical protein
VPPAAVAGTDRRVKAAAAKALAAVDAADEMRASLAADDGPVRIDRP